MMSTTRKLDKRSNAVGCRARTYTCGRAIPRIYPAYLSQPLLWSFHITFSLESLHLGADVCAGLDSKPCDLGARPDIRRRSKFKVFLCIVIAVLAFVSSLPFFAGGLASLLYLIYGPCHLSSQLSVISFVEIGDNLLHFNLISSRRRISPFLPLTSAPRRARRHLRMRERCGFRYSRRPGDQDRHAGGSLLSPAVAGSDGGNILKTPRNFDF